MHNGQRLLLQSEFGQQSLSLRTADAGGMGFVGDHLCAVPICKLENFLQWSAVAIHAEKGFRDDYARYGMPGRTAQLMLQIIEITMGINYFPGTREPDAIDQA